MKTTLGLDLLWSKTIPGVVMEMLALAIVYNLVRRVMHEAGRRQAQPGEAVPQWKVNPARPGRFEPRVRKRRPKEYPVMQRPRAELRQAMLTSTVAA